MGMNIFHLGDNSQPNAHKIIVVSKIMRGKDWKDSTQEEKQKPNPGIHSARWFSCVRWCIVTQND